MADLPPNPFDKHSRDDLESSTQALLESVAEIARSVAAVHADDVDANARFPQEAISALQSARAMSAPVPVEYGGMGCTVSELARICNLLSRSCPATGMILAMHYIQIVCLVNHRTDVAEFTEYLASLAKEQRLIASVTSEVGTNGDLRSSVCAPSFEGAAFQLSKQATTVSYGVHADDLLITARKSADSASSDQILVLALAGQFELQNIGQWDTLGMRGTCSPPSTVAVSGCNWQILDAPFATIASHSMVPISHVLWSSVWLGIAADAVSRLREHVNKASKAGQNKTHARSALAKLSQRLNSLEFELSGIMDWYAKLLASGREINAFNFKFSMALNNLKVAVSEGVIDIVVEAIKAMGISAYRNGSPLSLGRHLRDAMSAPLMVSNDRLMELNRELQTSVRD